MIRGIAAAKLNLSLRVAAKQSSGLHPVDGLFQSVSWFDRLLISSADFDSISDLKDRPVIAGQRNLAMTAVGLVREATDTDIQFNITLDKQIATAAGLGGGSADAAVALAIAAKLCGMALDDAEGLAPTLGSDVPFCFRGGSLRVAGAGEVLDPQPPLDGFAVALVVPPLDLRTADVYNMWDRLEGPSGDPIPKADLPPSLRPHDPLINDLWDAAVALAPIVADWRDELKSRWGRAVALTGSGPTLFAFFLDEGEATSALMSLPAGARHATAVVPVDFGWAYKTESGATATSLGLSLAERWSRLLDI